MKKDLFADKAKISTAGTEDGGMNCRKRKLNSTHHHHHLALLFNPTACYQSGLPPVPAISNQFMQSSGKLKLSLN